MTAPMLKRSKWHEDVTKDALLEAVNFDNTHFCLSCGEQTQDLAELDLGEEYEGALCTNCGKPQVWGASRILSEMERIGKLQLRKQMITDRKLERQLREASAKLKDMLKDVPALRKKSKLEPDNVDTGGCYISLATWGNARASLELWLDRATGKERFWYGFVSSTEEAIMEIVEKAPEDLRPVRKPIAKDDWSSKRARGIDISVYKSAKEEELSRPCVEFYPDLKTFFLWNV